MPINSYEDLEIWQIARVLVRDIYTATRGFPREELYGLTSQVRRAAVSVPSNIAEGHARDSTKDFLRHLSITLGSLAEVETQLVLANDLSYLITPKLAAFRRTTSQLGRMIRSLQKSLKEKVRRDKQSRRKKSPKRDDSR